MSTIDWPLYERIRCRSDIDALKKLFLYKFPLDNNHPYHGSQWAAEAISDNPELKLFLFKWLDSIKWKPEVIEAISMLFEDENMEFYFTKEEMNKLRLLLQEGCVEFANNGLKELEDYK